MRNEADRFLTGALYSDSMTFAEPAASGLAEGIRYFAGTDEDLCEVQGTDEETCLEDGTDEDLCEDDLEGTDEELCDKDGTDETCSYAHALPVPSWQMQAIR